jgi:plastocyanin
MEPTSRTNPLTWALALVVPVVAVVAAVVTLTVTSDNSGNTGQAAKQGNAVTIENFAFSPTPLRVKAGTAVTVANQDHTAHTLTADDGAFDTSNLDGGAKATITVTSPGTYAYHCDIHNYMTGKIEAR